MPCQAVVPNWVFTLVTDRAPDHDGQVGLRVKNAHTHFDDVSASAHFIDDVNPHQVARFVGNWRLARPTGDRASTSSALGRPGLCSLQGPS